jgi:hypothetical protein
MSIPVEQWPEADDQPISQPPEAEPPAARRWRWTRVALTPLDDSDVTGRQRAAAPAPAVSYEELGWT